MHSAAYALGSVCTRHRMHTAPYARHRMHTAPYAHGTVCTRHRMHTAPYAHGTVCTQHRMHTAPYAHGTVCTRHRMHTARMHTAHRIVCTQNRRMHTESYAHRIVCTRHRMHTAPYAHRCSACVSFQKHGFKLNQQLLDSITARRPSPDDLAVLAGDVELEHVTVLHALDELQRDLEETEMGGGGGDSGPRRALGHGLPARCGLRKQEPHEGRACRRMRPTDGRSHGETPAHQRDVQTQSAS